MTSKTRMLELVKAFAWREVDAGLSARPELVQWRDERGRNWLHVCCGTEVGRQGREPVGSIRTADVLLSHGLDIDQEAFSEDGWRATPLWYAIGRGRNLALAQHLLKLGSNPNYCLFAAVWNDDLEAIRLLMAHGADVDDPAEGATPFLGAVKWSRFAAAEELLKHGADPDAKDAHGRTALHSMLKKGSDKAHFETLARYGARGDVPDAEGRTAVEIMRRKRDPVFQELATRLRAAAEPA